MTIKNYEIDAYTLIFDSQILEVSEYDSKPAIILKDTFFYPEGGGQPCDYGTINNYKIISTEIKDGIVYHLTDEIVSNAVVGTTAHCEIDAQRRFSLMQQHTGQHILSACAEKNHDAATVGFHIGLDYVTVDLDKKISDADVIALELYANQVIFSNLRIIAHYPTQEELLLMPLRKQPKIYDKIRVIEVEGFDFSPCGGTHTKTSSEIGLLKINKTENYKNGIRITFVCGYFALEVFKQHNEIVNSMSKQLSVSENEIVSFTNQLVENLKIERKKTSELKHACIKYEVDQLIAESDENLDRDIKLITLVEEHMSMADLRLKVAMICEESNYIVLASSTEDDKQHVVLSKSKEDVELLEAYDMNQIFKQHLIPLGVKGGGNAFTAQGGIVSNLSFTDVFEKIEQEIIIYL